MVLALSVFKQEAPNIPKKVFPLFFMYLERLFFICFRLVLLLMNFLVKFLLEQCFVLLFLLKKKGAKEGIQNLDFFFIFHPMWVFVDLKPCTFLKMFYHISNFSNTMSNSHEKTLYAYSYIL